MEEIGKWDKGEAKESLERFKSLVKRNTCVNTQYCTEWNICLIQNFVAGYKFEDMKQNLLLVARDIRKKLKTDFNKNQPKIFDVS